MKRLVVCLLLLIAFVLLALADQEGAAEFFGWLRPWLTSTFDWFLVGSVNIITLFCLVLIILPVGSVRIGGKDAKPDYSYAGWIAMMFAAGIGIGLLFFAGFAQATVFHDAAHDTRHAIAFPCH